MILLIVRPSPFAVHGGSAMSPIVAWMSGAANKFFVLCLSPGMGAQPLHPAKP
ncbi:hypothetical protein [Paraburkholderia hayleyella]|uniref:hypothetical protein n=1 Tax=Paraburkholderia hayleyella TaxID=2152889 RepID=UPI001291C3FC|nr:hypothetical protein [Paraburkholderia hayleyella]